ncbi:hypothetical protein BG011_000964 [Mortierella polycephala]|uniref:Uncharacterized protein n=1 Tax=Mortierella polycephala TaxID=41804 RepID=A0A9P6PLN0_9FUNG|nr:hypothetical protein BG011_000964 [Mortierella polycephala]
MKPFEQFANENKHKYGGFDKLFSRYSSHVGRQKVAGDPIALTYTLDKQRLRQQYDKLLIADTIGQTTESASKIVGKGIARYTRKTLDAYQSEQENLESKSNSNSDVVPESEEEVDSNPDIDPESEEEEIREETPTASPAKRRRVSAQAHETQEPWLSLTVALIDSMNGTNTAELPPVPADMSADHLRLFRHARTCLKQYQKNGGREAVLIKDAMGDQMLNCTKVVRKELQAEFGDISDSGRRCDLFFRSGENELANLEIKPPSRCGSILAQQNRKNVRINRCIQLALHEVGLDTAVIAGDIVGFFGVFYVIQRHGDIFVCGPVTAEVVYIPTNAAELEDFLDGESSLTLL